MEAAEPTRRRLAARPEGRQPGPLKAASPHDPLFHPPPINMVVSNQTPPNPLLGIPAPSSHMEGALMNSFAFTVSMPPSSNNMFATYNGRRIPSREYKAW